MRPAANNDSDTANWRVLLNRFYEYVSSPAYKIVSQLFEEGSLVAYEQNVSSTTNNNNNKIQTNNNIQNFVSEPANKLGFLRAIAILCNEDLQSLREKEGVTRLFCLLLEREAQMLNSPNVRSYYRKKAKKSDWWTLYNQDADDLVALGLAEKRELHPDVYDLPLGKGRKPFILCIKGCSDHAWRTASLDAVTWRQGKGAYIIQREKDSPVPVELYSNSSQDVLEEQTSEELERLEAESFSKYGSDQTFFGYYKVRKEDVEDPAAFFRTHFSKKGLEGLALEQKIRKCLKNWFQIENLEGEE